MENEGNSRKTWRKTKKKTETKQGKSAPNGWWKWMEIPSQHLRVFVDDHIWSYLHLILGESVCYFNFVYSILIFVYFRFNVFCLIRQNGQNHLANVGIGVLPHQSFGMSFKAMKDQFVCALDDFLKALVRALVTWESMPTYRKIWMEMVWFRNGQNLQYLNAPKVLVLKMGFKNSFQVQSWPCTSHVNSPGTSRNGHLGQQGLRRRNLKISCIGHG